MAQGLSSDSVKEEFKQHAAEEQDHADRIAERIVQLGGEPDLNPANLVARAHSEYVEGSSLVDMIRDAHRIMLRLEETMDRFDKMAQSWDDRIASFELSPDRLLRMEQALFNIERGMMGVEASFSALPRAVRTRIDRGRRPTTGDTPPAPRPPY